MKYGLSLEQGKKKVDEIISSRGRPEDTRVAQLEEEVRKLGRQIELKRTGASSTAGRGSAGVSCSTCTRPTHSKGICPGKKVECYSCGLTGHFKGSTVCKGKPAGNKTKTRRKRANQVDELEEESDAGDSIGQVSEDFIQAAGISPKIKTAEIQLTALDHGNISKQMKANMLIDSAAYRTLFRIQPEGANKLPKLKKSMVRLVPYGNNKTLELLGRSRCQIKAGVRAEVTTIVYVVRGVKESLLGLRDRKALGFIKIQPEGDTVRMLEMATKEADPPPGAERMMETGK